MLNQNLLLTGDDGYNLTRSLRFRSSASAYLNRTPATTSNQRTWTFSTWVKRGALGGTQQLLTARYPTISWFVLGFTSNNNIEIAVTAGSAVGSITNATYRDPSAWYHVVLAFDSTQAVAADRTKLYVNGVQQTFSSTNYPALNTVYQVNQNVQHTIGGYSGEYFDGYQTEINLIDGQALTPSSFGETNPITGVWQPAKYTGTYGTNGFYLPFTDNSALTTSSNVGLGKDYSGNGNYWTTNNISITSGSTYDSMTDVPTLTSATTANYAVMNPLNKASLVTVTDGNLTLSPSSASWGAISGTVAVTSGKWYYEYSASISSALTMCGWATTDEDVNTTYGSGVTKQWVMYFNNGNKYGNGSNAVSYATSVSANTVVGVALDMDNGTLTFYIGGVSQGTAFNTGLTGKTLVPWIPVNSGAGAFSGNVNFGQRPFAYTPPTGFVALNTFNLPEPSIKAGNKYMDVSLWTGDGTTSPRSITNAAGFKPDLVWSKDRTSAYNHQLFDSVRGTGSSKNLMSNSTDAEGTNASSFGYLSAFNSNGFALTKGSDPGNEYLWVGKTGDAYVAWQWQAGQGTTSSNTAGSITSTVSANPTAGFSVVTYTGNGTSGATVGHGLGVAPSMVICKERGNTGSGAWAVKFPGATATQYLVLNTTAAAVTTNNYFTANPDSSVFYVGNSDTNRSGSGQVAYCFAEVAGYSKFGSYTGNGSTDGTFVHLGFRPKFIIVKSSTFAGADWVMYDTARNTYNALTSELVPNSSASENNYSGSARFDFLSNGFKARTTGAGVNNSGSTYIYMAFAENPFKNSLAR